MVRYAGGQALTRAISTLGLVIAFVGCSPAAPATVPAAATQPVASESSAASESSQESPSTGDSSIFGEWHRAQSCKEMLAAFERAGLAQSHRGWLQGNFFGGDEGPQSGDPCAGAEGPLEHDHFFTEQGEFGSHDENGEEVDSGDYEVVDDGKLSFPSHAEEFGYSGDILVDYAVNGDVATFDVKVPSPCDDACADAYAWALSAFASGAWERGGVP